MTSLEFVKFALQISVMLGFALLFGQFMRRIKQPPVLGEMIGGIILGPTIFGLLMPGLFEWQFESSVNVVVVRDTSIKLGILFFLFIAGLETNIADLKRLGWKAILIGLVGTLTPVAAGVALVYALPRDFWGEAVQPNFFAFALFVGMNLANSANPVLARILMDLGLLNSRIGTMCMSATIVDDLVNWTLFAIILSDISPSGSTNATSLPVSVALVALAFILILVVGRWIGPHAMHWIKGYVAWPSGFISSR